jgi:hypothetical protein
MCGTAANALGFVQGEQASFCFFVAEGESRGISRQWSVPSEIPSLLGLLICY